MADGNTTTLDQALAAYDAWAVTHVLSATELQFRRIELEIRMRQMEALEKIASALDREMSEILWRMRQE